MAAPAAARPWRVRLREHRFWRGLRREGPPPLESLSDVLARIDETAARQASVSVGDIRDALGDRSFGPLLLVPGLVVISPLSGIPTVPSMMAAVVLLIGWQMLADRSRIWLPRQIEARCVPGSKLRRVTGFLSPWAGRVDRLVRPRLHWLTGPLGQKAAALHCMIVALTMPPMEILPFLNSVAGLVIAATALGMTARDGLLMLSSGLITAAVTVAALLALT
ncbi:exopolysaccharide biosynthesis protein [Geminicoccus flavidas]|uniref:exopolysaccharide biosynthesis protein n=1 Tax=Geminicoccus flavidas TaxID=2506407 RepID=UPI00135762C4|nr:exopolysaccharide biosynthesis protein [Geminicoccus flavidas]